MTKSEGHRRACHATLVDRRATGWRLFQDRHYPVWVVTTVDPAAGRRALRRQPGEAIAARFLPP